MILRDAVRLVGFLGFRFWFGQELGECGTDQGVGTGDAGADDGDAQGSHSKACAQVWGKHIIWRFGQKFHWP